MTENFKNALKVTYLFLTEKNHNQEVADQLVHFLGISDEEMARILNEDNETPESSIEEPIEEEE